jgi:AcrR family transcriptional regulator
VAWVAAALVARDGVEALTMRGVAEAAGSSTSIVTHYFADRRDLLLCTFQTTAARAAARMAAAVAEADDELAAGLEALLPLDDDRQLEWKVWFAFWGLAVGDPALSTEQRRYSLEARALIAASLERDARTPADVDVDLEARRLLALLHGIAAQTMFVPEEWPAERQQELIRDELLRVRAGASLGAGPTPA